MAMYLLDVVAIALGLTDVAFAARVTPVTSPLLNANGYLRDRRTRFGFVAMNTDEMTTQIMLATE